MLHNHYQIFHGSKFTVRVPFKLTELSPIKVDQNVNPNQKNSDSVCVHIVYLF